MNDLLHGSLKELLQYIQRDNTLDLQIRNGYINVYYRGGNILKVTEGKRAHSFWFDFKYVSAESLKDKIKASKKDRNWKTYFSLAKEVMNEYFSVHKKTERFIQHEMVTSPLWSDRVLTDIEYQKGSRARFDLLGIKIGNDVSQLSLIELKHGYSSLRTIEKDGKETSGLCKHLKDVIAEIQSEKDIRAEIEQAKYLIHQKKRLGLQSFQQLQIPENIADERIEVVFALADYQSKPGANFSTNLKREVEKINHILIPDQIQIDLKVVFLKTETAFGKTRINAVSEIVDYLKFENEMTQFYS